MHITTRVDGGAAALALSLGALASPAMADGHDGSNAPEACSKEQKQLDKAEDALERLTAVFEAKKEKVKKAKKEKKNADKGAEKRAAKADLAKAKDKRSDAKENQKAQQKRVEKASERLEKCEAAQEDAPTEPAED